MVEVKICGLTSFEDAAFALEAGADYLGFVLHPPSPRGIRAETMADIIQALPAEARAVAVCVHQTPAQVRRILDLCPLHAVQWHGDQQADRTRIEGVRVWRSVKWMDDRWQPEPEAWAAERYVVDANVPGLYGGTGVTADWQAAATLAAGRPVMLGGGLTPSNVAAAVAQVAPRGVDVASGVEAEPGRKAPGKVRAFIEAARQAAV
jgi:phosphoribosylanthranilate isomerase